MQRMLPKIEFVLMTYMHLHSHQRLRAFTKTHIDTFMYCYKLCVAERREINTLSLLTRFEILKEAENGNMYARYNT